MASLALALRFRPVDVLSGALTSVIVLTSTLSYVAFICSAAPAEVLPYALGFGLAGAGLMAFAGTFRLDNGRRPHRRDCDGSHIRMTRFSALAR